MMNPEIKEEWLAALRSGEYEQGQCQLRTEDNAFCCLGVLSDIMTKKNPDIHWIRDKNIWKIIDDSGCSGEILTDRIASAAGLAHLDPRLHGTKLSSMNDSGYTFEHIANVIEEHL